ncbi:MAG: aldehyde dehydrogenase family protein [Nannocystaceae bacterium]
MPAIVSPIDGQPCFEFNLLDKPTALVHVDRAHKAQRDWAKTPLAARIRVCKAMLDRYAAHLHRNADEITRMMGKPLAHARGEFSGGFCERTRHLCRIAEHALRDIEIVDETKPQIRRWISREPVGVVMIIAAWNYPLLVPVGTLVSALLAGNAVLIKHAPQTALVADQLERAFIEAGAPEGLVQAFHVDHPTAAAVFDSRKLGYVAFTGSVRGGHEVSRAVAQSNFIGVGLELGGKDAALVLPDSPIEKTAANLVEGALFNAGQSCCGIERVYVHHEVHDQLLEAMVAEAHRYKLGNPLEDGTNLGPVVHAASARRIRDQVAQALAAGARQLTDDSQFSAPDGETYVRPKILTNVDHSMAIMSEETFGPVVGVMSIESDAEAVRLMNDSAYGLTGSIWSEDFDRAQAIAEQLEVGTVFMNRCDYLDPALAWSGVKDSGHGVSLSALGFSSVTRSKSFHMRRKVP